MQRNHHSDYNDDATTRCERVLLTLIGDIGPWSKRIYLAGGLAPHYIVGRLPHQVSPHIGTTDVDLVIGLAIDDAPEAYQTLQANLRKSHFKQTDKSYQWGRDVDGVTVMVEFLCETDEVEHGRIYRPKEGTGSKIGAFNVPGAQLAIRDFTQHRLQGERLDGGGLSAVNLQVVGVLTYTVLKTLAFQDRHDNKDAYDLIFTLMNYPQGPREAGRISAAASIADETQVVDALKLLAQRFKTSTHDGPTAHANFLAEPNDQTGFDQLRNQAVAAVRQFLDAFHADR